MMEIAELPYFLKDYGDLSSYFQSQFEGLGSIEKGRKFLRFALRVIMLTDYPERFQKPEPSKKESHDGGVDAEAIGIQGQAHLYIQSKYAVKGVNEIDSIVSKFKDFLSFDQNTLGQNLFGEQEFLANSEFLIISLSKLGTILQKYEASNRSSLSFYNDLKDKKKIRIIDGIQILDILQKAYRKMHIMPSNFELKSDSGFLDKGNVFVGLISSSDLQALYGRFGDSLFLENIREYLGERSGKVDKKRETVNTAIKDTLEVEPNHFLARNNGITFRARKVKKIDDQKISLDDASIVNGCQTTMSVVKFANDPCYILAKIVEVENSWDIAKAANYQNHVSQLDLELAQYIRPQIVRNAASNAGIRFENENFTPFSLIEEIYQDRINYKSIRSLFLGLFSRTPNNTIENNYTEIIPDTLDKFFKDSDSQEVFEALFHLARFTDKVSEEITEKLKPEKDLRELFKRFWNDSNTTYRAFMAILASCGVVNENIFQAGHNKDYPRMKMFLKNVEKAINENPNGFRKFYFNAFKVVASDLLATEHDRDRILQSMYNKLRSANFGNLFNTLRLENIELD